MFEIVPQFFGNLSKKLAKKPIGDAADYLPYATAILALVLAITISARQYIGSPIQCLVPAEWPRSWEEYAEAYCFTDGGYYVARNEMLRNAAQGSLHFGAPYYQWVPLILLLLAFFFYLPSRIWQWLLRCESVIDYDHVLEEGRELRKSAGEEYKERLDALIEYLAEKLEFARVKRTHRRVLGMHVSSNSFLLSSSLSWIYGIAKLTYVGVVAAQFAFLHYAISPQFWKWWQAILGIGSSTGLILFPTEIMCDVLKRDLSPLPVNVYSLQCLIMVNQWNEKVLVVLGVWLVMMLIVGVVSFLGYVIGMMPCFRRRVVRQLLADYNGLDQESEFGFTVRGYVNITRSVSEFADQGLGSDGFLLLRFIEGGVGGGVSKTICEELFLAFQPDE